MRYLLVILLCYSGMHSQAQNPVDYFRFPGNGTIVYPTGTDRMKTVGNLFYFAVNDENGYMQLWRTDGTDTGTIQLTHITDVTAAILRAQSWAVRNNILYFNIIEPGPENHAIWRTDGTITGTYKIPFTFTGQKAQLNLIANSQYVFFQARHTSSNPVYPYYDYDLYDINNSDIITLSESFYNFNFDITAVTVLKDKLVFGVVNRGTAPPTAPAPFRELHYTDGNNSGTVTLTSPMNFNWWTEMINVNDSYVLITPYNRDNNTNKGYLAKLPGDFSAVELLYQYDDNSNTGRLRNYLRDMSTETLNGIYNKGDTQYFSGLTTDLGTELWQTDGSNIGTLMIKDLNPGTGSSVGSLKGTLHNGLFYFTAAAPGIASRIFSTDGTAAGTLPVSDKFANFTSINAAASINNKLFLYGANTTSNLLGVWQTDGTDANSLFVTPNADFGNLSALWLAKLGDKIIYHRQLFTSTGYGNFLTIFKTNYIAWNGNTSNAWHDPTNWDCNCIPGITDNVIIPRPLLYQPTISGSVSFNELWMNAGTLSISANSAVNKASITRGTSLNVNPGVIFQVKQ